MLLLVAFHARMVSENISISASVRDNNVNKLEFSCAKLIAKHPLPVKNVRKITQK